MAQTLYKACPAASTPQLLSWMGIKGEQELWIGLLPHHEERQEGDYRQALMAP